MFPVVFDAVMAEYPEKLEDFPKNVESAIKATFYQSPDPVLFFGLPGSGKTVVLRVIREMSYRLHSRQATTTSAKATAKKSTAVIAPTKVTCESNGRVTWNTG